ncbi:GNAT family N-acetyltransferase [Fodinibius sp.]|uniref:GNAT family N-acetyltransferase n=1 Tax=Fodinibius sp. TaxID=1872440 RepID=UPI0035626195
MKQRYTDSILTQDDIDEAFRLSSQVGWNQTKSEWARLIELNPETCFAIRDNKRLVGTATLAAFGTDLGWIGMVIVDKSYRGMGMGKQLLERAIDAGREQECDIIGLDATDQGRRLYKQYGFCDVRPIDRWMGGLSHSTENNRAEKMNENHLSQAIRLDRQWSGCDRGNLIRHLFSETTVRKWGVTRKNQLKGMMFIRGGREYFHLGPIVTDTTEGFTDLLSEASRVLRGEPVLLDCIRCRETSALLRERGLKVQRSLTRMTLDEPRDVLAHPKLRAAVSFEWG